MSRVKITVFADPMCTWCWGSVPVVRALEYRYAGQLDIEYVMGGMVEDIRTFSNRRLEIGGDIALSNRNIHKHWLEASLVHGMPVSEKNTRLFDEHHLSSFPMNYAYIASKWLCKDECEERSMNRRPERFLRRIQKATALYEKQTTDKGVLADIAVAEGFEREKFLAAIDSNEVKQLFDAGRDRCRSLDVHTFPSYLIEYKGSQELVQGYTTYGTLQHTITRITYGDVTPKEHHDNRLNRLQLTAENLLKVFDVYHTLFPVEVATIFGLERRVGKIALNTESYLRLPDVIDEMLKAKLIAMSPAGNGFKFTRIPMDKG